MCTIAVAQGALALGGIQPSEAAIISNSSRERVGRTVARQLAHDEISAVERLGLQLPIDQFLGEHERIQAELNALPPSRLMYECQSPDPRSVHR
jgi:hypothetical protein